MLIVNLFGVAWCVWFGLLGGNVFATVVLGLSLAAVILLLLSLHDD